MTNGSPLAKIAYLKDSHWTCIGKLMYFRSHDVRIKLTALPLWAMAQNQWMLGTFTEQFKVGEAPYLDGAVVVKTEDGIEKIGHLITYQNETGDVTHYMVKLHSVPIERLVRALKQVEVEKKSVWLDVILEDEEEG